MTNLTLRTADLPVYSSHELQNALACIRQFGNILVGGVAGELSDEQREHIRSMLVLPLGREGQELHQFPPPIRQRLSLLHNRIS